MPQPLQASASSAVPGMPARARGDDVSEFGGAVTAWDAAYERGFCTRAE